MPAPSRPPGPGCSWEEEGGEKFEAKSARVDCRGARSWGGVWLSARTDSADTQPRHVDRHRPRTRTQRCAHPHPQPNAGPHPGSLPPSPNHGHTKARADACPRTKFTKTHKRTCPHKDPRGAGRRPRPQVRAFVSWKPPFKVRAPHSGRAPGVRRPLPTPWVREKLRGPGPAPASSAARPPDGAARLG